MVLAELCAYLESKGIGTQAVDIFYGVVDADPDACIALFEEPGQPNEPELGGGTVRLEFPVVEVITRGVANDYDGPRLKINRVVEEFTKISDELIGGVFYLAVLTKSSPNFKKRDANFRVYFSCRFQVTKEFSTI